MSDSVGVYNQHRHVKIDHPTSNYIIIKEEIREEPTQADWESIKLHPTGKISTFVVYAEAISTTLPSSRATLGQADSFAPQHWELPWWSDSMRGTVDIEGRIILEPTASPSTITFRGLQSFEWSHARSTCRGGAECPQATESRQFIDFPEQFLSGGTATLTGTPDFIAFLDPTELSFHGTARLPRAVGELECENCTLDGDTLVMHGDLNFTNFQTTREGGFTANLGGTYSVRINETPTGFVSSQTAVAVVAAVALGLALLWKILAALVSQQILSKPLELRTRRLLLDVIKENPGATARELRRVTEFGSNQLLHHVTILRQAREIRSWRVGRNVHYSLHSIDPAAAMRTRALDDQDVRQLHAFILEAGEAPQKTLAEWAERSFGWARSTLQSRLQQLADVGLLTSRTDGRWRVYAALPVPQDDA